MPVERVTAESEESVEAEATIPVIQEELDVQVLQKVTGVVRLEKAVRASAAAVDQELMRETLSIERVAVNRDLSEPAAIRQEGETTIIPVMEEIVVVSKRLVLKEEIRITRVRESSRHQETVTLRAEEIHIERLEPDAEQ